MVAITVLISAQAFMWMDKSYMMNSPNPNLNKQGNTRIEGRKE
jgi:hypothetical protein